jgi:outer membrane murein-binding lipoprotein Lpp
MIGMFMQAASAADPWLGLDWKVVGIGVSLLTAIIGGMLGLVYKLIVSNFAARVDLFDQKVEAIANEFKAANNTLAEKFKDAVDKNSALDNERLDRLREDLKTGVRKREKLEADFRDLLERLPVEYVHRDDWVRGFSQLDGKIDKFAQKTDARLEAIYELISNTRETVASKG